MLIGADIALFKALLKGLVEADLIDHSFIQQHTTGWQQVSQELEQVSWQTLIDASGVSRRQIGKAVMMLAKARRGIICWSMGITHHAHGVDNILAIANLAMARAWLGKPGCGLLPLRGHSNVQGVGSMGVVAELNQTFAEKMQQVYALTPNTNQGMDTYAAMQAASAGQMNVALLLGGNLFASNPDRHWAAAALKNIDCTIYISTKMNEGHVHGRGKTSLILPALARDEEAQATTQESMFNFVRYSAGGKPVWDSDIRSEVDILASIAERVLPKNRFDWSNLKSHQQLRNSIAKIVPGYADLGEIDQNRKEFQVSRRTFHQPEFATSNRKANFHVTPLPESDWEPDCFRLTTVRSEGQFNTVVYDQEDLYRGNKHRDVVMMSADDVQGLGAKEGDRVVVMTEIGKLEVNVSIVNIRSGSIAMYYPEANVLVPRRIDKQSGTPAFKSVSARVCIVKRQYSRQMANGRI